MRRWRWQGQILFRELRWNQELEVGEIVRASWPCEAFPSMLTEVVWLQSPSWVTPNPHKACFASLWNSVVRASWGVKTLKISWISWVGLQHWRVLYWVTVAFLKHNAEQVWMCSYLKAFAYLFWQLLNDFFWLISLGTYPSFQDSLVGKHCEPNIVVASLLIWWICSLLVFKWFFST